MGRFPWVYGVPVSGAIARISFAHLPGDMQVTPCYPCLCFMALEKSNRPLFGLVFIKHKCLQIH